MCIDGQLCCKNIWPNKHGQPHFGSISHLFPEFGQDLFINGTSCHSFVFAGQKYGCSTFKFLSFMFALMASFVAKICGLTNMVENSLKGQFQNFEPELFTNNRSCHGFAFAKQTCRCRTSNFFNCPLIVALFQ